MVATENGVRMTDMELRHRVEEIIAFKGWTTNRVAAEIPCSEQKLVEWLEHAHVVAFTNFRGGLMRFVERWQLMPAPPPDAEADDLPPLAIVDDRTVEQKIADGDLDVTVRSEPESPTRLPADRSLPAGFEVIAPARSIASNTQPAGLSFSAAFDRATLSKELAAALGNPQRVLIAANPLTRELLVRAATADEGAAMKVSKGRDVSKSVAERAKAFGASKRFYPASETGDGTWRVKLAA